VTRKLEIENDDRMEIFHKSFAMLKVDLPAGFTAEGVTLGSKSCSNGRPLDTLQLALIEDSKEEVRITLIVPARSLRGHIEDVLSWVVFVGHGVDDHGVGDHEVGHEVEHCRMVLIKVCCETRGEEDCGFDCKSKSGAIS
jgi:hypothetical protein